MHPLTFVQRRKRKWRMVPPAEAPKADAHVEMDEVTPGPSDTRAYRSLAARPTDQQEHPYKEIHYYSEIK